MSREARPNYHTMACRHWPPDAVVELCPVRPRRSPLRLLAPLAVPVWLALVVYGGTWLLAATPAGPTPTPPAWPTSP
jgi:hypothetical protein